MFTHEKRWSLWTRRKWLGGSASASSITVNPWSMPVTIKEISFHRSLNNRSIKLSPLFPGAFYMQIAPSISAWWLLQAFVKWVFMYHHFYETFPRATKPANIHSVTKSWGLLNTISHAIYVCGNVMHGVELNDEENLHHMNAATNVFSLASFSGTPHQD